MSYTERFAEALAACETQLQRIAAEAMSAGDYPAARSGLELAEAVAGQRSGAGLATLDAPPAKRVAPVSPPAKATAPATKPKRSPSGSASGVAAKKTSGGGKAYPKFVRDGDKLVKIGWSKRSKEEYTHKAPRAAVDALVAHLRKHTQDGRLFTIDDLLPVPDPENAGDLPAYQVYLGIAWLRSLGVLHKHGRDGYSVEHDALAEKPFAQVWDRLPSSNL